MSFFFKNREQEGKTGPIWRVGTNGREEDLEKGCRRVNMVEILCTHVYKWENETCFNYSRNRGREDKEERWRR
jgi:hypothetical protein